MIKNQHVREASQLKYPQHTLPRHVSHNYSGTTAVTIDGNRVKESLDVHSESRRVIWFNFLLKEYKKNPNTSLECKFNETFWTG